MAADVWSFGIILWEVANRRQPFAEMNANAIMYQVSSKGLRLPAAIEPGAVVPQGWLPMMGECWRPAELRPAFEQLVERLAPMMEVAEHHRVQEKGAGAGS
jgi:hypothetical protein